MKELAPGIYSLGHGKGGHVHAFLLEAGGELSLVDTLFEGDARLVLDALRRLGRSAADLKRIAITHGHRSHLGGLAALKRASGATVYAHRWEADIVAGERIATWPNLCAGWRVFNLNHVQHKATLTRLASFEPLTVGVGHGDPMTENTADHVQQLAEDY